MEKIILLSKKLVHDFDEIIDDVTKHKMIIFLDYDDENWSYIGRIINENNYDDFVAYFWQNYNKGGHYCFPDIYVDVKIIENGSLINIEKGKYYIQEVGEII